MTSSLQRATAIVGALLLVVALVWAFLLVFHPSLASHISSSLPGAVPTPAPETQISALEAEGITLQHPSQAPGLSQQQALLLASQLVPQAAAQARNMKASYVLLNYPASNFNNAPAWMIVYQQVPVTFASQSHQDLYLFLDANSGRELLAIWA
ncbi:MAG TPA: hypothetical protein VKV40_09605 [Ktedonobacteraceae bacterium]|nr:hypothetical protein [Ktedonobacteraceae bacterium]